MNTGDDKELSIEERPIHRALQEDLDVIDRSYDALDKILHNIREIKEDINGVEGLSEKYDLDHDGRLKALLNDVRKEYNSLIGLLSGESFDKL